MEGSWERGEEYRHLRLDDASSLLAMADMTPVAVSLITEGKANTNYRVELTDGRQVVLRLHMRDPGAALIEKAVADLLADEIPVPCVLFHSAEAQVSVLEWKPGLTMERLLSLGREAEVASAAEDIGRTLALISAHRYDEAGFLNAQLKVREAWPTTLDGLLGYLSYLFDQELVRARAGSQLVEMARCYVDGKRPRLEETVGLPCLTHGDYKAANVLVHEGRLSAVLDWEFVHSGTYLMSVGQVFRHALPDGFAEGFVRGFGELPPDWRELGRAIDLLSMFDFLNRPTAGERLVADVLGIVRATVA